MLNMKKVCSDSEFMVRKELTGFMGKNFHMLPRECFMWVTSRIIDGGDGFTVESPFKNYANKFLLIDRDGRHFVNDLEMMLLSERCAVLDEVQSTVGSKMDLINSYYLEQVKIPEIVESLGKTYGVVRKIFGDFHREFSRVVSEKYKEYRLVDGTSVLSLKIGWKPKNLLWNAGIHSVEELNTCFYTGSTDISKILNSKQLTSLSDALKNLETA